MLTLTSDMLNNERIERIQKRITDGPKTYSNKTIFRSIPVIADTIMMSNKTVGIIPFIFNGLRKPRINKIYTHLLH